MLINAYGTHRDPLPPLVTHRFVVRRYRRDPELEDHLAGLGGWVLAMNDRGARRASDLVSHIERVWFHWAFETTSNDLGALETWATRFNVLFFVEDSTLRDPAGRVLVAHRADASVAREAEVSDASVAREAEVSDVSASVPRFGSALARKQRTIARLDERRIPVLDSWPALANDEEAEIREVSEVVDQLAQRAWSAEALAVLHWALGMTDVLAYPQQRIDPAAVIATSERSDLSLVRRSGTLRSTAELLDMADLHHRLLWAVVEAPEAKRGQIDRIVAAVVVERWRVFAWLLGGDYQASGLTDDR